MKIYKGLISLGFILLTVDYCYGAATIDQLMSTGKMMRDICQPKFKLSDELANKFKDGEFPEDTNAKCYVHCILEMMQCMKKSKFLYESSIKQIELMMPDDLKAEYVPGLTACKNSADGIKNNCEAAYALLKCLKTKISNFVFP